jgi:hypothetical protein
LIFIKGRNPGLPENPGTFDFQNAMSSHPTALSATSTRQAFQRKLALIWAIGTLLPLAVLAALYVLAPLPMHAATGAVWVVSGLLQTARRREAGWQPVKIVRRLSA